MGFILASQTPINTRPDPEQIDKILQEKTKGGFRTFDGIALLGMLNTPGYIRKKIATETQIYTLDNPPVFFGQGVNK